MSLVIRAGRCPSALRDCNRKFPFREGIWRTDTARACRGLKSCSWVSAVVHETACSPQTEPSRTPQGRSPLSSPMSASEVGLASPETASQGKLEPCDPMGRPHTPSACRFEYLSLWGRQQRTADNRCSRHRPHPAAAPTPPMGGGADSRNHFTERNLHSPRP